MRKRGGNPKEANQGYCYHNCIDIKLLYGTNLISFNMDNLPKHSINKQIGINLNVKKTQARTMWGMMLKTQKPCGG